MDHLAGFGTTPSSSLAPTALLYRNLLLGNAASIRSSHRQEYPYGPHPRQVLDVYHAHDLENAVNGTELSQFTTDDANNNTDGPQQQQLGQQSASSPPILCFFYGGGFIKGSKRYHHSREDLMFANVGHFFASKGFTTIIADYRLAIPDANDKTSTFGARFPDGGHDVNMVVEWIRKHFSDATQKRDLFLMATSAGGAHLATFMLHHTFQDTRDSLSPNNHLSTLRLRGVIYVSAFLEMDPLLVSGAPGVSAYYGPNTADWLANSPLNLLRLACKRRRRRSLRLAFKYRFQGPPPPARTPTLALIASLDPEVIVSGNDAFHGAWDETKLGSLERAVIEGHNHFSHCFGLGTGSAKEEMWGYGVMEWMRELCDLPAQRRVSIQVPGKDDAVVSVTMEELTTGYGVFGY